MLPPLSYIVHIHNVNLFGTVVLLQRPGKSAIDFCCVEVRVAALDELQLFVYIGLSSGNVSYCEFVNLPRVVFMLDSGLNQVGHGVFFVHSVRYLPQLSWSEVHVVLIHFWTVFASNQRPGLNFSLHFNQI